ncbi:hypothetical protein H2248_012361 [Termitomyces sp. 'cryptogamus']|nr:hypothetical protein H2248_012361 [Termitomyces sp. 'cryptogamus']
MLASKYPTVQFLAGDFVISAGSVLFRQTPSCELEICLLESAARNEWVLPKGRKDRSESIENTAVRETLEETGYPCELWPLRMPTRAPTPGDTSGEDVVKIAEKLVEPIAITVRDLRDKGAKIIWWYITRTTGQERIAESQTAYEAYKARFMEPAVAIERLTYQNDREIVQRAWDIVSGSRTLSIGNKV